ncbi:MAG: universal stress protein [Rhodothermales bacterium]
MPYNRIVVALAGKEDEKSVIDEAVRLASKLEAELTVLHVNDRHAGEVSMMMDSEPLISEDFLRSLFRQQGYERLADDIEVMIVVGSSYPKEIARATQEFDLLVIGHRRRHGFLAAFIDSVDKHMMDLVSCPVLIVPRQ